MPKTLAFLAAFFYASLVVPAESSAAHDKAQEINATCAACHGEFGQGGKKGEYPRLAGQRAAYLADQLRSFRSRSRVNIPMFPYTQERELTDEDIRLISEYLAETELPTKLPVFKGDEDALTRLLMVDKVMIIPRAEGDVEAGGVVFQKRCATCHARNGMGRGKFPRLVGQYTPYLKRQVELYLKGDRPHDDETTGGVLNTLSAKEIQDILAYLTAIQEKEE